MPDAACLAVESENEERSLALRVAGLFAILVASAIGIWLPWLTKARKLELATFFGTVFAAGVVLATGFVHILPDGADALTNPCLGLSGKYPWAESIAGGSVLVIFTAEYFLRQYLRRRLGLPEGYNNPGHARGLIPEAGTVMGRCPPSPVQTSKESTPREATSTLLPTDVEAAVVPEVRAGGSKADLVRAENTVAAATLEMGIIFHSVFVGIDFGVAADPATARALLIALTFHQGFEGLALGAALVRAGCGGRKFALLALVFCLITPFGCAIGLGLGSSYNDNGRVSLGFNGAFQSVSAGILIYNGLVDLVLPVFTRNTILGGRVLLQMSAVACLFAGYCAMALLAKWA